jgi:beta-xylosidase
LDTHWFVFLFSHPSVVYPHKINSGNAINNPNQLSLARAGVDGFPIGGGQAIVAATGLFAPTIRHHKGVFYIVCTNVRKEKDRLNTQNFYVTTRDIWSNQWSDPVYFDFEGIDPSLFFDEDDCAYIQGSHHAGPLGNPMCSIRQFKVNILTGKPLSETRTLWTGHLSQGDVEGPHIYKKDDYYYLLVAEGGTWQHHCITIARSSSIWGPYEGYKGNPILTADGMDEEYVQHTGHGDLFEDGNGNWWAVHLGIRSGEDGRAPLGRETFLTPVKWPKGGWPEIRQTSISFGAAEVDGGQKLEREALADVELLYLRSPQLSDYTMSSDRRKISLVARGNDLSTKEGTATFLARRQRHLECTATATLHLQRGRPQLESSVPLRKAGLSLFKDDVRHVDIYYDFSRDIVELAHTDKVKHESNPVVLSRHPLSTDTDRVVFEIRATPNEYGFIFRELTTEGDEDAAEWVCAGSVDSLHMTALDFTGSCFGIFASTISEDSKSEHNTSGRKFPVVLFEDFAVL